LKIQNVMSLSQQAQTPKSVRFASAPTLDWKNVGATSAGTPGSESGGTPSILRKRKSDGADEMVTIGLNFVFFLVDNLLD